MDEEQKAAGNQAEEAKDIKRSFTVNKDNPPMYEQKSQEEKSGKKFLIIIVVLMLLLAGGYFAVRSITQPAPVTTPTPLPTPAPTSTSTSLSVLNRSDWSLEILNGSGVTGAAKKISDKVRTLGYPVVKTGNADKDSYSLSQILVKKELESQIELVIADLKDTIKISSVAGELKEGTASARVIIGKDNI